MFGTADCRIVLSQCAAYCSHGNPVGRPGRNGATCGGALYYNLDCSTIHHRENSMAEALGKSIPSGTNCMGILYRHNDSTVFHYACTVCKICPDIQKHSMQNALILFTSVEDMNSMDDNW